MDQPKTSQRARLPNGAVPGRSVCCSSAQRLRELETLCSDVYFAAVNLGLPQPLLNRLWTTVAHGSAPSAFQVDLATEREKARAGGPPKPLDPDLKLIHHPRSRIAQMPSGFELMPLPERRTVLAVDDDPFMLDLVAATLRDENYTLLTTHDAYEALELGQALDDLDLLLTDYLMPGLSGRELASALRKTHPDLRVLYETGFSEKLFENVKELEPRSAFIEKPFTARGLCEAVRLALFGAINPSRPIANAAPAGTSDTIP